MEDQKPSKGDLDISVYLWVKVVYVVFLILVALLLLFIYLYTRKETARLVIQPSMATASHLQENLHPRIAPFEVDQGRH